MQIQNDASRHLLEIRGLKTHFQTDDGWLHAVDGVDLTVDRGETLGVVGESGCGKSVTAMSVLKLLPMPPGRIVAGQILWQGRDLVPLADDEMRAIRAKEIAIVFQEPMTSLNPVYTVGEQIAEVIRLHEKLSRRAAMDRAAEMLKLVQIPTPARRVHDYPHQFSGGMRQRVMIAMALACNPKLLIADEPTTALDVTIQAQILDLLGDLKAKFGMAVMLITHAMGVVAETAQRVVVMYAGKVVEEAPVAELFGNPRHPYTQGLIRSIPRIDLAATQEGQAGGDPRRGAQADSTSGRLPLRSALQVRPRRLHQRPLRRCAPSRQATRWRASSTRRRSNERAAAARGRPRQALRSARRAAAAPDGDRARSRRSQLRNGGRRDAGPGRRIGVRQVDDGSLHPAPDRTDLGEVWFEGNNITHLDKAAHRRLARDMQIIFQDPYASLNPRMTVAAIIGEALTIHKLAPTRREYEDRIVQLLETVGLSADHMRRYPHEFSGGQRQRIGIARALAVSPKLVVCDEAVSALDVSIQAQVINLLEDLRSQFNLTYLFIAHDLSVVEHISHRVAVMYLGRIVEIASAKSIYTDPKHPYTEALLAAVPIPDPQVKRKRIPLQGDVPSPINPPSGCRFHTRCPIAQQPLCSTETPLLKQTREGHWVACHLRN